MSVAPASAGLSPSEVYAHALSNRRGKKIVVKKGDQGQGHGNDVAFDRAHASSNRPVFVGQDKARDFTYRLTEFRDPISIERDTSATYGRDVRPQLLNKQSQFRKFRQEAHHRHHKHKEPEIITADNVHKFRNPIETSSDHEEHEHHHEDHEASIATSTPDPLVKVSIGLLLPSDLETFAPLYPPVEEGNLQLLIQPLGTVGQQSVHHTTATTAHGVGGPQVGFFLNIYLRFLI